MHEGMYETCERQDGAVILQWWGGDYWSSSGRTARVCFWRGLDRPHVSADVSEAPLIGYVQGPQPANTPFLRNPCSCGGENENCFHCGGWGYVDPIGLGRSTPESLTAETEVTRRSYGRVRTKLRAQVNSEKALRPRVQCDLCGVMVRKDRYEKHLSKVHRAGPLPITKPGPLQRQQLRSPTLTEPSTTSLDATRDYYAAYREQGRFGSHPSHDGFDDESSP